MRFWYSILFVFSVVFVSWSQCMESSLLRIGGDFKNTEFIDHCPTYNFEYNRTNDIPWKLHGARGNSSAFTKELNAAKENLETKLQKQLGTNLYSKLELQSVSMSVYDSISKMKSRYPVVDMYKCRTKYFFFYHLVPSQGVKYCVGIALDDYQNIISELPFPSADNPAILDSSLNVCNVVKIAKETGTPVTPIEDVYFDYDFERGAYVWVVRQKVRNPYGKVLEYNEVTIEAVDGTQTTSYKKTVEN